ncbi:MAG: polyprenyl synthetase family protein [Phycisphaerales bacterium]|nr:polyprenyl synthetase family protein [Phycisphaerales bacterium]
MPNTQSIPFDIDQIRAQIDHAMAAFLDTLNLPPKLDEPIRYALLAPGKRIRPLLAWASAQAAGGDGSESLPVGVAVELIHAFSLVHDDLPALDNDDLRRGRPTLHKHAGEAAAILAGDAMLALAFESLSAIKPSPTVGTHAKLITQLCQGTRAMIVGQVYDTLGGFDDSLSDESKIKLIHTNKTGALIHAACIMGATAANADQPSLDLISGFACDLGLKFQIIDDLLDVQGDPDLVGKALRKDDDANKLTYPAVLGIDQSNKIIGTLHCDALSKLDQIGPSSTGLRLLLDLMTNRSH